MRFQVREVPRRRRRSRRAGCRLRRSVLSMLRPAPAPPATRTALLRLWRLGRRFHAAALMQETTIDDPARCRGIADCVEGAVVGHDLEHVAGSRLPEPASGRDRDPQVAPVAHAERGSAVYELRAERGEMSRKALPDRAPVADRGQLGRLRGAVDLQGLEYLGKPFL